MINDIKNCESTRLNRKVFIIILLFLITKSIGVVFLVKFEFFWMGVAELIVAGLLYATADRTQSNKIKTFMYVGMAILLVLAGYQFISAFTS